MFGKIAAFELRYQVRQPIFWIAGLIFFLLVFGSVVIDQIQIAYREDIRWDTQPAGADKAIITIAGRPETQPEDNSTDPPTTSPSAAPSSTSSGAATPSGGASGSPSSPPSGTPTGIVPRTTGATPSSNATP